MKSTLTLRLDDDLRKRAKQLAKERGTSVPQIVEDYFRLLLHRSSDDGSAEAPRSDFVETPPTPYHPLDLLLMLTE